MQTIKTVKRFLKIYCRFYSVFCLNGGRKDPTLEESENVDNSIVPIKIYYRLFAVAIGINPDRILTKKRYEKIMKQFDDYDKKVEMGRRGYIQVLKAMEKYYVPSN